MRHILVNFLFLVAAALVGPTAAALAQDATAPQVPAHELKLPAPPVAAARPGAGRVSGKVLETMEAGGYTYVRVDADGAEVWAAAPRVSVSVGDNISFERGMEMRNFRSDTLDRSFESIYFAGAIEVAGAQGTAPKKENPHGSVEKSTPEVEVEVSGIERAEGGKTVAEIHEQKDSLAGQEVVLRGKVVKVNHSIMGRNWLHLRDGTTSPNGDGDLTVTTADSAALGDTVVVRGNLATNKDFGFGYHYDVLIEDAKLTRD